MITDEELDKLASEERLKVNKKIIDETPEGELAAVYNWDWEDGFKAGFRLREERFGGMRFGKCFVCRNGKRAVYMGYSRPDFDGSDINFFAVEGVFENSFMERVEYDEKGKCRSSMPNPQDGWDIASPYKKEVGE